MDFGDILDEWEKRGTPQPKPAGKPAKEPSRKKPAPATEPPRVDPLTAWLRLNPVYDKDAEAPEETAARGEQRRRLRHKRPDAVLDLHGLLQDEAWIALETFFEEGRRRGFEKLLIVHGKGNHSDGEGPLRRLTARFIEQCPFAGESGHSSAAEGGSGATWVILREERKNDLNSRDGRQVPRASYRSR